MEENVGRAEGTPPTTFSGEEHGTDNVRSC